MHNSGRSSHRNSPERGMEQSDMGASQRNTGGEWRADRHGSGSPNTVPPELRSLMERAQTASGDNNSKSTSDASPLSSLNSHTSEIEHTPSPREAPSSHGPTEASEFIKSSSESAPESAPESEHSDYKQPPESVRYISVDSESVRSESPLESVRPESQQHLEHKEPSELPRRRRRDATYEESDFEDRKSEVEYTFPPGTPSDDSASSSSIEKVPQSSRRKRRRIATENSSDEEWPSQLKAKKTKLDNKN